MKNLELLDASNQPVDFQINPVFENSSNRISETQFELSFIADLNALVITTYYLKIGSKTVDRFAKLYCANNDRFCLTMADNLFDRKEVATSGDIQLQNDMLEVYFDGSTGLLKSIKHLDFDKKRKMIACKLMFGAYTSAQFHSGAYLFMPEPNSRDFEKGMFWYNFSNAFNFEKKLNRSDFFKYLD